MRVIDSYYGFKVIVISINRYIRIIYNYNILYIIMPDKKF